MGNKKCLKPPASISGMWGYGYGIHDDTTERLFLSLSLSLWPSGDGDVHVMSFIHRFL